VRAPGLPVPVRLRRTLAALLAAAVVSAGLLWPLGGLGAQDGAPPGGGSTGGRAAGACPFADLAEHWARPDVEALVVRGALAPAARDAPVPAAAGGTDQAPPLWRPDDPVTRADFVMMLVRAFGRGADAETLRPLEPPFSDVTPGTSVAGHVNAAVEAGFVRGYPDGTFRPDRPVSRAEIAALLARSLGLGAPGTPGAGARSGLPFSDRAQVPSWAVSEVVAAWSRGLVRGYPDRTFRPTDGATRAEAASLIARAAAAGGLLYDVQGIVRGRSATGDILAVDLWPAGRPAEALTPDGTLEVRPLGELGEVGPGPTVFVKVAPGAAVFRNGEPTLPADLDPLDEVALILDAEGQAAYVRATLADGLGRLVAVSPTKVTLEALGGAAEDVGTTGQTPGSPGDGTHPTGRRRTLDLLPWAALFVGGRPAGPEALRPGQLAYFILDSATGAVRVLAVEEGQAGAGSAGRRRTAGSVVDPEGHPVGSWPSGVRYTLAGDPAASTASVPSPREALALNASAVRAGELAATADTDGTGVLIAVIDTGADPAHPDLAMTSSLERKVVDWCDFTGEGDVQTTRIGTAPKGTLETELGPAKVAGLGSKSGFYHSGVLSEASLDPWSPIGGDLDRNGSSTDRFLVVAVDRRTPGVYDTVYVDTDRDLDLTDEVSLRPYRETGLVSWFGDHARSRAELCSFVVADLRSDGNRVTLGFDGNGHGTHVAATAAGYGSYRGGPDGLAPGAKLLVLKALGCSGDGSWSNILRAVQYAASRGAEVILLSVTNLSDPGAIAGEAAAIADVAQRYGALVVLAAGNDGPGLGTLRGPGGSPNLISVAAGLTPEMWLSYYGYAVGETTVWPYSSVGPRPGGSSGGPDVVAPASALAAAPRWLEPPGYAQYEGTSMAAPHVAGVAALLWEAARDRGLRVTGADVREAILAAARPLPGYTFLEQGHGWLDALAAGERLLGGSGDVPWDVRGPEGRLARDWAPALLSLELSGGTGTSGWLELDSDAPWLVPLTRRVGLVGSAVRQVPVRVSPATAPGLRSAKVTARTEGRTVWECSFTEVTPVELHPASGLAALFEGSVPPARVARHFVRVPPGASALVLTCGVPASRTGGLDGRVQVFLYTPDGRLAVASPYLGEGSGNESGFAVLRVPEPAGGVWEAVVYGSAALSVFGLERSAYWLEVVAEGLVWDVSGACWEVAVPARPGSAGVAPASLSGALAHVWKPVVLLDEAGRPAQAWGPLAAPGAGGGSGGGSSVPVRVKGHLLWTNAQPAFEGDVAGFGTWGGKEQGHSTLSAAAGTPLGALSGRLEPGETATRALGTLDGSPGLLRVALRGLGAGGGSREMAGGAESADLDLRLYRRAAGGTWQECAASATEGLTEELIELEDPPAGEYAACVTAGPDGGPVDFELTSSWLPLGAGVRAEPASRSFGEGASGTLDVTVEVPGEEGVHLGAVRVTDQRGVLVLPGGPGATVSLLPVAVRRVGEPLQLIVQPGWVTPGSGLVTFRACTRAGKDLGTFVLEVGGRCYQGRQGRVSLPVQAAEGAGVLRLEVGLSTPEGAGAAWVFYLPVRSSAAGDAAEDWLGAEGFRPAELGDARQRLLEAVWGGGR